MGLTILSSSCVECFEIWNPQGMAWPVMGLFVYLKNCNILVSVGDTLLCLVDANLYRVLISP